MDVAAVVAGDLPVARGVALNPRDAFIGAIIERLMCDFQVDVPALAQAHGRGPADTAPAWPRLARFQDDGLITVEAGRVSVSPRGQPFVRAVCAAFDPHTVGEGRHARVV